MSSRIAKGARIEKIAADQLTAEGYLLTRAIRTKWQRQDMFNCWDIIAIKTPQIRFIQVSASPIYDRGIAYKKKLADFPQFCKHASKEYWWYQKGGGWQITVL